MDRAYRVLERPVPKHLPGCGCALCAGLGPRDAVDAGSARNWTAEDVVTWCARAVTMCGPDGKLPSCSDRAVFRFLLPRMLEMVAAGACVPDGPLARAFALFRPGQLPDVTDDAAAALLERFARLVFDRAIHDPVWPLDVLTVARLFVDSGWSMAPLARQAMIDPEMPAALARVWGGSAHAASPRAAATVARIAPGLRDAFVGPLMVERLMNYAMAEGTPPEEMDAAMRAADLVLRGA